MAVFISHIRCYYVYQVVDEAAGAAGVHPDDKEDVAAAAGAAGAEGKSSENVAAAAGGTGSSSSGAAPVAVAVAVAGAEEESSLKRGRQSIWGEKQEQELSVSKVALAATKAIKGGEKSKAAAYLAEHIRALEKEQGMSQDARASTSSRTWMNVVIYIRTYIYIYIYIYIHTYLSMLRVAVAMPISNEFHEVGSRQYTLKYQLELTP